MEPSISPKRLEKGLELATIDAPLPVVLAWLQAGARPTREAIGYAIAQQRMDVFHAMLDSRERRSHDELIALVEHSAMLGDDDALDVWLDRLTPDDLNTCPDGFDYPAWFVAFIRTPATDNSGLPDRVLAARLPHVLGKFRQAGANLQAMENDPDYGLNGRAEPCPHYDTLRIMLRIPYEHTELHAVVDQAMIGAGATSVRRRRL